MKYMGIRVRARTHTYHPSNPGSSNHITDNPGLSLYPSLITCIHYSQVCVCVCDTVCVCVFSHGSILYAHRGRRYELCALLQLLRCLERPPACLQLGFALLVLSFPLASRPTTRPSLSLPRSNWPLRDLPVGNKLLIINRDVAREITNLK
jgi:hypothetical protein